MNHNYAVYVRVSTDRDEQVSSVENQIDICRNWLERNGYEWNEESVFKDEGISGTVFLDRPAIQLLLDKTKKGEVEMIVFKSISRLARDLKDSLEIRETLLAHNVRVISIEEGFDSFKVGKNDMVFELWSLFAAQYSRTLSSSISAALAAKVRRGEHIGKIPFGYDRIDQKLVINEEEAKVVRQMFHWYNVDKWGFKRITKELNDLGLKPKQKDKWQVTSVQRILQNPIYHGKFILNQYTTVKVGGRKKQIRNPEEKWIIFENHHPPIVTTNQFEKANSKDFKSRKTKITPWNEFRDILKCAHCGSNMVIMQSYKKKKDGTRIEWKYLKCSKYRRYGAHGCVNHEPIRYEQFREFILRVLIEKGESIRLNFDTEYKKKQLEDTRSIENKIVRLEQQKKDVLDLYLNDRLISKAEFKVKRDELDKQISKLNDKLFLLTQDESTSINIETIRQAFKQLENEDSDLYYAFQQLLESMEISQNGTLDIRYRFEQMT
ncbi:recombinase family protein [Niallia circulans]|uniref:recombinase family protein n=1 Tax=Niallia circulans TaxID=1397 RepID=UPI000BA584AC|nr:recombinase family protein [Niallia circulans]PAD85451.1 recombinase family protein [Niallia circulans]